MWDEAEELGAGIAGGDLVSCPQWVISVTVLGDLDGRAPVLRSGAKAGSVIAVAGELGRSAAGYALWHTYRWARIDGFADLRRRHLVPQPPYGEGAAAAVAGAQAMIDVSDGLVADLRHVAEASGVTLDLSTAALAADRDARWPPPPPPWAPTRGRGCWAAAKTTPWWPVSRGGPAGWREIGRVLDSPGGVLVDGEEWRGYPGWESFGR